MSNESTSGLVSVFRTRESDPSVVAKRLCAAAAGERILPSRGYYHAYNAYGPYCRIVGVDDKVRLVVVSQRDEFFGFDD